MNWDTTRGSRPRLAVGNNISSQPRVMVSQRRAVGRLLETRGGVAGIQPNLSSTISVHNKHGNQISTKAFEMLPGLHMLSIVCDPLHDVVRFRYCLEEIGGERVWQKRETFSVEI